MNVILPLIVIVNNLVVQGPVYLLIVGNFVGLKSKFWSTEEQKTGSYSS